jgi:sugar O-acyltransferase (sialic acid O-acetyltransferase NeuD family)
MLVNKVAILGAGRQALETVGYCAALGIEVAIFVEEQPPAYERSLEQYSCPIRRLGGELSSFADLPAIAAVGSPGVRRRLVEGWPGDRWFTLVSDHAWVSPEATIGAGSTVAPMAVVNRFAVVGPHVIVNTGATISHDTTVGEFTSVGPGVSVGGCASIGAGVVLGIGATIRDRVRIGDDAFVAAGAVVVDDVQPGVVVMGVPARPTTIQANL